MLLALALILPFVGLLWAYARAPMDPFIHLPRNAPRSPAAGSGAARSSPECRRAGDSLFMFAARHNPNQ